MQKAKNRLRAIVIICTLGFGAVFVRIVYLTFFSGSRPIGSTAPTVVRGPILDRRGLTLAHTEEASSMALAPHEIIDAEFTAQHLSRYLDERPEAILEKLNEKQDRKYFYLKRQVDDYLADQIMDLHLPGVYREREFRRTYPAGKLAGNLLGFVGRDRERALAGLERTYNDLLVRPEIGNARRGPALNLTIDSLLQYRLEQELGAAFEDSQSKRAVGIIMNVTTGEILAMANYPNYDPNEYYRTKPFQRGNWAIRYNYEPGSTVKLFMAAILLSENAIRPEDRFNCDGEITFGDVTVRCMYKNKVHKHGLLTFPEILYKSCNVGIIKAMQRVPGKRIHYYMKGLGFGEKTQILPGGSGETAGYFPPLNVWVPSTAYYMPIGQSFSATPLQLLRAASSVAREGMLVRPYIADKITTSGGRIISRNRPEYSRNRFSPAVNRAVLRILRGVVTRGTGGAANIPEIAIAGKTGTAQKATARGYADRFVASFVGFFPAENPRYGMLILFDEPSGHASGGSLAAPVFRRVVRAILPVIEQGVKTVDVQGLALRPPAPIRAERDRLHDFRGLSAREAVRIIADQYRLPVVLLGSGYVFRQQPPPGTRLEDVRQVRLYLDSH